MDAADAPRFKPIHDDDDFELLLSEEWEMIHLRFRGTVTSPEHAKTMTERLVQVVRDTLPSKRVVVVQDMRSGEIPLPLLPIIGRGLIPLGEQYTKAIVRYGRRASLVERASTRAASLVARRPIHSVESWRDVLELVQRRYPPSGEAL